MIYLFIALYSEAHIFIKAFHLEKNQKDTKFQQFQNETAGILLTITGVGEIAAAAAVGSVCTRYRPKENDVLLNIGTCAHTEGRDGVFLCNKMIELATGKTFYPDILYRHDFQEESIVTGMRFWNRGEYSHSGANLYDMEAAAIYQAGSYFFGPHQMIFLKVVSDDGAAEAVTKEQVGHLMETYQEVFFGFIKQLQRITAQENKQTVDPIQQEALIEKLCTDLHCSKVMRDSLVQHIRYLSLAGMNDTSVIQEMYQEGLLPCKDKREGKLRFEELKRRLL